MRRVTRCEHLQSFDSLMTQSLFLCLRENSFFDRTQIFFCPPISSCLLYINFPKAAVKAAADKLATDKAAADKFAADKAAADKLAVDKAAADKLAADKAAADKLAADKAAADQIAAVHIPSSFELSFLYLSLTLLNHGRSCPLRRWARREWWRS